MKRTRRRTRPKATSPSTPESGSPRRRRSLWLRVLLATLVVLAVGWLLGLPGACCRALARRALRQDALNEAQLWTARARQLSRFNADNHLLAARIYARQGMTANGLSAVKHAADEGADEETLRDYTDLILTQRGDLQAAERLSAKPSTRVPPRDFLFALTKCAMFHARFGWSFSVLERWQDEFPADPLVAYLRGRVRELTGDKKGAITEYQVALERRPTLAVAAFRVGVLQREQREFDEALAAFGHCVGTPFEPIAAIELADCQLTLGEVDAAWTRVAPVVTVPPTDLLGLYLQVEEFVEDDRAALVAANIRDHQGNDEAAIPLLERVLDYNPRNVAARARLAACLRRSGRAAEAGQHSDVHRRMVKQQRECLQLGVELEHQPDNVALRCDLAELYLACQSLADAQHELQIVLAAAPDLPRAHRLLAQVYREKARYFPDYAALADHHEEQARQRAAEGRDSAGAAAPPGQGPSTPAARSID